MLVKIKEILTKMYFHMPCQTLVPIYATYITIYRLHFWSKISPIQGIQTKKYRFFPFTLHSPGAQNKVLSSNSIQTDVQR